MKEVGTPLLSDYSKIPNLFLLEIPSLFVLEINVVLGKPSLAAALLAPADSKVSSSRARSQLARKARDGPHFCPAEGIMEYPIVGQAGLPRV